MTPNPSPNNISTDYCVSSCSSMDRTSVSGTEDQGSTPCGSTSLKECKASGDTPLYSGPQGVSPSWSLAIFKSFILQGNVLKLNISANILTTQCGRGLVILTIPIHTHPFNDSTGSYFFGFFFEPLGMPTQFAFSPLLFIVWSIHFLRAAGWVPTPPP